MPSIIPKTVELPHEWVLNFFNYHEPYFYDGIFDESEEGPFEVVPCCAKFFVIKNQHLMLLSIMFISKARVLGCYVHCRVYFLCL